MDDKIQKYLDEIETIRAGCETISNIIESISFGEDNVVAGFIKLSDTAIAKCKTATFLVKLCGETLDKNSEKLIKTTVKTVKENYIPIISLALMYMNISSNLNGNPNAVIRPEA